MIDSVSAVACTLGCACLDGLAMLVERLAVRIDVPAVAQGVRA